MARIRTFKPEFFMDEKVAELPMATRLLFMGLWTLCDVAGRCEDRPKWIKANVFPYDPEDVDAMLATLEEAGFICRYESGGKRYLWVRTFRAHQRFSGREATTPSTIPAAPCDRPGSAKEAPVEDEKEPAGNNGSNGEANGKQQGSTSEPRKGKERNKEGNTPLPPSGGPWEYLPPEFDIPAVREVWKDFEAHRRALGKANGGRYSPKGLEAFAGSVTNSKATPCQLVGFVAHCMASGWNGLPPTALPRYVADHPDSAPVKAKTPEEIEAEAARRREMLDR